MVHFTPASSLPRARATKDFFSRSPQLRKQFPNTMIFRSFAQGRQGEPFPARRPFLPVVDRHLTRHPVRGIDHSFGSDYYGINSVREATETCLLSLISRRIATAATPRQIHKVLGGMRWRGAAASWRKLRGRMQQRKRPGGSMFLDVEYLRGRAVRNSCFQQNNAGLTYAFRMSPILDGQSELPSRSCCGQSSSYINQSEVPGC